MLLIFRKLRRSFFLPGKLQTYLAYAVGEIVLIVLGILIALQINSWNEERKEAAKRSELIAKLKTDFETNVDRLDVAVSEAETLNSGLIDFLRVAAGDNSHLSLAELKALAMHAFEGVWFRPDLGTYISAQNTGAIGLIEHSELKELFVEFEAEYQNFQGYHEVSRQGMFVHENYDLRRRLGSLHALYESTYHTPEPFKLSDSEYRAFIAEKEVYAAFENRQWVSRNTLGALSELKETTQQILAVLNELK